MVKWFKNGIEITPGGKFSISEEPFSSVLTVKQLNEKDEQIISCMIVNPLGKESCEAQLKIKGNFKETILT